jgi:thiamine pyrophosphokinase
MSARVCHVVCAGPCAELHVRLGKEDMLIAADGGYAHCMQASLKPDLYIGDLDSLSADMAEGVSCERIELPRDKDDTDTMAACKEGLARGFEEFRMYAALGGDIGHELANMQLLAFLRRKGASGVLYGTDQEVHLVDFQTGPRSFVVQPGTRVSVFSSGGPARGVCLQGLHWELDDAVLRPDLPLGVSNRADSGTFVVSVASGELLVVIG